MTKNIYKARCAALILLAAGYGWAGGHYIPANSPLYAYLFQFVVLAALLLMGLKFFGAHAEGRNKNWAARGLGIFSIISFLINILNIVHGAFTTDPHSFGSHNTFADLVPIAILLTGSGLWVITMFTKRESSMNKI